MGLIAYLLLGVNVACLLIMHNRIELPVGEKYDNWDIQIFMLLVTLWPACLLVILDELVSGKLGKRKP